MKRNNKAIALILSLVMVLSVAMIAHAAETENLSDYLEMTVAKEGDTVSLTIKAKKDIESLGAFQTGANGVSFDDSVFTFVSCAGGTSDIDADFDNDTKQIIAYATGDNVAAGGTLVTLTFTAGSGFDETEDYDFTVKISKIGNANGQAYAWSDGSTLTATLEGEEETSSTATETTTAAETTTATETTTAAETTAAASDTTTAEEAATTAEEAKAVETTAAEKNTPDTGDHSHMTFWYIMLLASAVSLMILAVGSKKRRSE